MRGHSCVVADSYGVHDELYARQESILVTALVVVVTVFYSF